MKSWLQLIFRMLLVFLACDVLITLWFVYAFYSDVPEITFKSIQYIFFNYGTALSVPATLAYGLIYNLFKTMKKGWPFYLVSIIILGIAFFATAYIFTWYMISGLLTNDLFVQ
jgi:hypothetical protein